MNFWFKSVVTLDIYYKVSLSALVRYNPSALRHRYNPPYYPYNSFDSKEARSYTVKISQKSRGGKFGGTPMVHRRKDKQISRNRAANCQMYRNMDMDLEATNRCYPKERLVDRTMEIKDTNASIIRLRKHLTRTIENLKKIIEYQHARSKKEPKPNQKYGREGNDSSRNIEKKSRIGCKNCARVHGRYQQCRAKNQRCNRCGNIGHYARVCSSKKDRKADEVEFCDQSVSINNVEKAPTVVVKIADQTGKSLGQSEALLDTGADITIADQRFLRSIGLKKKD